MNLEKFYKSVEGVTLFPGSIMEFTAYYGRSTVPVKNPQTLVTGIVIPSLGDITEALRIQQSGADSFAAGITKMFAVSGMGDFSEHMNALENQIPLLEEAVKAVFSDPKIQNADIRMKAMALGADAVVHFQLYDAKNTIYMGIPVRGSDRTLHFH
jgi:hypothetical protein